MRKRGMQKATLDALKRVKKARKFPINTCPSSRHVQIMAENLLDKGYPMLAEEPEHCAQSLLSTVAALYEARNMLRKMGVDLNE